jgi:transposase-like protein
MAGRKRTNQESRAFKARIVDLRSRGKPAAEIARELGVTRQYVSLVLAQTGVANARSRYEGAKPVGTTPDLLAAIARLEQQGQSSLAEKLRKIRDYRAKVKRRPSEGE